jgi:hypothetical protein
MGRGCVVGRVTRQGRILKMPAVQHKTVTRGGAARPTTSLTMLVSLTAVAGVVDSGQGTAEDASLLDSGSSADDDSGLASDGDGGLEGGMSDARGGGSGIDGATDARAAETGADSGARDAGAPPAAPGEWVLISAGTFTMGSPDTEDGRRTREVQHQVTLTEDYWLMTTEVTQEQFETAIGYNPSHRRCGPNCPLHSVNWYELVAYANALSQAEGLGACYNCAGTAPDWVCSPCVAYETAYDCPGYRLPTEAEWEYAARGGTTAATYNGDLDVVSGPSSVLDPIAWFGQEARARRGKRAQRLWSVRHAGERRRMVP